MCVGSIDNTVRDVKRIRILTETFIATDKTGKYTDIRVILAELSGGTAAGTENRRDKVHTLQLEGYSLISCCFVWRIQLLCTRDTVSDHHARIMRDFTPFFNLNDTVAFKLWNPYIFSQCTFCLVHSCNSYSIYRQ